MRRIGLLYDIHIVSELRSGYRQDGVEITETAIDKLNERDVDWTVVGGDLRTYITPTADSAETLATWEGDENNVHYRQDFVRAKELLDERLQEDYYIIRGNNDRPIDIYREVFPAKNYPLWFWFEDAGARFVFLDSNPHQGYHHLTETQNFVSAPQLSMLDRLMDRDPDIPTFVFIHAPLAKHPEVTEDWESGYRGSYYITANYPAVQRVLERGNTILVNSGHFFPDEGRGSNTVRGVTYALGRHLVRSGDPDERNAGDVRWMDVDTETRRAVVRYYDIGEDEEGVLATSSW